MENDPSIGIKIGVVGGGSWGTAISDLLGRKGYPVDLWVFEKGLEEEIRVRRENSLFLPGIRLSPNIHPSNDLERVVSGKDLIVMVVPSHVMRETAGRIAPHASGRPVLVSAAKGIERGTEMTMSAVLKEMLPDIPEGNVAVLSGPSFAREVAARVPTAVTAAASDPRVAGMVQHVFATPYFRVYTGADVIGIELGGAVKNVIAIAAGIVDGLSLGLNTRAALITRGLAEIRRLGLKLGADPLTFTGLAGAGDLILTCTGDLSRNHAVGKKIGEGKTLAAILSEMRMVAEGIKNAESVYNLSLRLGVEMPITHAIYRILYEDLSPGDALHSLMTRNLKHELD